MELNNQLNTDEGTGVSYELVIFDIFWNNFPEDESRLLAFFDILNSARTLASTISID